MQNYDRNMGQQSGNRNHDPRYTPEANEPENTGTNNHSNESGKSGSSKSLKTAGIGAVCGALVVGIAAIAFMQFGSKKSPDSEFLLLDNAAVQTNAETQASSEDETSDTGNDPQEAGGKTGEAQNTTEDNADAAENSGEGQGGQSALLDYLNEDVDNIMLPTKVTMSQGDAAEAADVDVVYDLDSHTVTLSSGLMPFVYGLLPVSTDRQRDVLILTRCIDEMTLSDPVIAFSEVPAILNGVIQKIEVGDTSYTFELNEAGQLVHITEGHGYFGSGETYLNYDDSGYLTSITKSDTYNSEYKFEYNEKHEIINFECKGRGKDLIRITQTSYFKGLFMTAVGYQEFTDCDHIDYSWSYDEEERLTGIDWESYDGDGGVNTYHLTASYTDEDMIESYTVQAEGSSEETSTVAASYQYSRRGDMK